MLTALVLVGITLLLRFQIPVVFGAGEEAAALASRALVYFGIAVCLAAVNRICTAYFYSVKSNLLAYITVYGEVAFLALFALVFPLFSDLDGIWLANLASQAVITIMGIVFCIVSDKKKKRIEQEKTGDAVR